MGFVAFVHRHLILLFAVLVMVEQAESSSSFGNRKTTFDFAVPACNGRVVGDCIDQAEEMMLDSEANRRLLAQTRYISYDALRRDNVPCNRRGASYYNCASHQAVNPYSRGCTRISMCARNTQ